MPIKVGITGGIGTGKTYICQLVEHLGYPVFYSDLIARKITETNAAIIKEIKSCFGENIYVNGILNRKLLARIVFSNKEKLDRLNGIVHPVVAASFQKWCQDNNQYEIVFQEAAILFETGAYTQMDKNILVTAPMELRLKRVMKRDGVGKQAVLDRMRNQMPDDEKLKLADFIIINDSQHLLIPQIIKVIGEILK